MDQPTIEFRGVTKSYLRGEQEVPVLRDFSLSVSPGTFLAIMGPSGSGKTTILNLIAGLDRPDLGSIHAAGVTVSTQREADLARWRARHIGFVFQFYNLIPVLTAAENVELPLLLSKLSTRDRITHVQAALGLVGLGDRMHHYPRQLSGGQEQRVCIARAIVSDPTIILADEPTGNLDRNSAETIMGLLTRLHRELKKTILMVTHDARAAGYAQDILHFDKGKEVTDDARHVDRA
ncbi:ABC transporter ATP-binding protein [Nitrospira sp. KM1]|uniref:ABC transporter ATP-binding protein n=1 Tax=Nitrospira sp. KM1 TaxID=1936990 RepID=UPI0013A72A69|nr:ABC transporter ATP-binding protein [Nitrospira sp. KM1]BCA56660.1 ABC transporter ATP-binding protein [Nitrospira sp. KM1]